MFIAGKFTCTFPETEDVQVICESSSQFDWIAFGSMVGTLLAVFASVATAMYAVRHSRIASDKAIELERKKRFQDALFEASDCFDKLRETLPELDEKVLFDAVGSVRKLGIDSKTLAETKLMVTLFSLSEQLLNAHYSERMSRMAIQFRPGSSYDLRRKPSQLEPGATLYQATIEVSDIFRSAKYRIPAAKDEEGLVPVVERIVTQCDEVIEALADAYESDD
ncbi:hypothetical protein [Glutamicibacter halophytocola]|uniref:Uncharacterized protein n=1 Tax=Glutamicibacter halophytocola TaxID=1933880 RepID=A0AA95BRM0_9MICC|nr:hypothetical protein [Glutamicibacter halophytocola]UUX60475.1 hypothetical protein NUH22_07675 [Glutamicibacter halophytocola]